MDHRIPRTAVEGLDEFDRLQALHEAGVLSLTEEAIGELTPGMRALSVLFAFVGTVDNGGFAACMYGSVGDLTGEAVRAARLIGADGHAHVFQRFIALGLGGDVGLDAAARERRLEAMSDAEAADLEALDAEFFALPSIDEHLGTYVDEHPSEFFRD